MGIRFSCPNGHRLNVKAFLAGRRGICPYCGVKFTIPSESVAPEAGRSPDASESSVDPAPPRPAVNPASQFERELELQAESSQEVLAQGPSEAGRAVASDDPVLQPAATAEPTDPAATNLPEPSGDEHRAAPLPPAAPAAVVDPFAEAPAAVWYVRPPSGGQFGPAQSDLVQTWLNEGRISPETFVWREGWTDWREAASVFPSLQPATCRATEPPVVSTSASPAGASRWPARRKTGPHLGLIVVLALAVVLLLVIFIWILQSGFGHRGPAGLRGAGAAEGALALLPQSGCGWRPGEGDADFLHSVERRDFHRKGAFAPRFLVLTPISVPATLPTLR